MERIAVLGAGVVGITTALLLQEQGLEVTVYTHQDPKETTSIKAGAVFEPYRPGNMSKEEMLNFVRFGLERYYQVISQNPEAQTGMRLHTLYSPSIGKTDLSQIPFLEAMPSFKLLTGIDVPGDFQSAVMYEGIPFIDPTKALPFFVEEFLKKDGLIVKTSKVTDLDQFLKEITQDTLINCTGLGSRELVGDLTLRPMRGQIVVLNRTPDWRHSVLADDGSYLFPRMEETILGGTTEIDEWQEITTKDEIQRIITRAQVLWPEINPDLDIARTYAGLRPFRDDGVRIEIEQWGQKRVIHNYGHGGSGWTFNWGSAKKVVELYSALTQTVSPQPHIIEHIPTA